jgi:hypothetical protein
MMQVRTILIAAALLVAQVAGGATVNGTTFSDRVTLSPEGPPLVLNGAGERTIMWFRVYAVALYLPVPARTLREAIAVKGPKRLHMVMLRDGITSKQVEEQVLSRIGDGTQPAEMALMKPRLDELKRIIDAEKVINRGGTIILDFVPGKGTIIRVNGAARGDPIPGEEFYNALLGIWLGDHAKSLVLRDHLLGAT